MILLADSGSTKTSWRLLDGATISQFETIGMNPRFVNDEEVRSILQSLDFSEKKVQEVFFYGAGCGSVESIKRLTMQLQNHFSEACVYVASDLLAAAHATLGKHKGLVGILGTGSNLGFYDGENLSVKVPSLGYVLGDEGSGSYLGRLLLSAYLRGELNEELSRKIKVSKEEVLENIYQKTHPNRYLASFSPFVFRNRQHSQIAAIIQQNFTDWIERYVLSYPETKELAVVGSVAFYFNTELKQVAKKYGYHITQVLENPIAALSLYHLEE